MKLFKIGELSDLFNIGVDSIRYYEKVGLLHPIRSEKNNYRLYTLDDVRVMNTIRELLDLGFQTNDILQFEKDRSLDHMMHMLEDEEKAIRKQIASLQATQRGIQARLTSLQEALTLDTSENITLKHFDERAGLKIVDGDMPDVMINYALANYTKADDDQTSTIGVCDCYILNPDEINEEGNDYKTKGVFFYAPHLTMHTNFTLPAGDYLTLCYRGGFHKSLHLVPKMMKYAKVHHLEIMGDPIEFCHIDRYETSNVEEYLIELQLPVA